MSAILSRLQCFNIRSVVKFRDISSAILNSNHLIKECDTISLEYKGNCKTNVFITNTVPADGLESPGLRTSAGTVISKC